MITRFRITLEAGIFTALADGATVVEAAFDDRLDDRPAAAGPADHPVARALAAYAGGDVGALERIVVRQPGSPFRLRAWDAMRSVPPGKTISYAELAARAGNPRAVRAAGTACATNAIPLLVPCHRIVRSDGSLGNYFYGPDVKERLLRHERGYEESFERASPAV